MPESRGRNLLFWKVFRLLILLSSGLIAQMRPAGCFEQSRQMVEVKHLSGHLATVAWYERRENRWVKVSRVWKAAVGRNGIGKKQEGDGKTPRGRFALQKVFGETKVPTRLPLFLINAGYICVDDPGSRYYGRLVQKESVVADFSHTVSLRRTDRQYAFFLPLEGGYDGSCIFLHPKRQLTPTGGGVALPLEAMRRLVRWLDRQKQPMIWIH